MKIFLSGALFALSGFRLWTRRPGAMLLGAVPPLIVGGILLAAWIVLAIYANQIATSLTPFADAWSEPWPVLLRIVLAVAIVAAAVVLGVLLFASLTLIVGAPIYERIWRVTEEELGGVPGEIELTISESVRKAIGDGLRLLGFSVVAGLIAALLGLIPLVGTVVGAIAGALFGGYALAIELTGMPGDARGWTLGQRQRLLKQHRTYAAGFGVAVYLLFLVPGFAVVAMPAMTVAGTLLLRKLSGEPASLSAPRV